MSEELIVFLREVFSLRALETLMSAERSKCVRVAQNECPIGQFSSPRNSTGFEKLETEMKRTKNVYFKFSITHRAHGMLLCVC